MEGKRGRTNFFVGSYATLPKKAPELEREFYAGLAALPRCAGLELAVGLDGSLAAAHANGEEWLLAALRELGALRRWSYILTLLPGTMDSIAEDPAFGLASDDPRGRASAVAFGRKAVEALARLNAAAGAKVCGFVEFHSGPSRHSNAAKAAKVSSSAASLAASLKELLTLDWQGAQLTVEHCDWHGGIEPVKGFLSLPEELGALQLANQSSSTHKVMLTINWARSVLETHEANTAVAHLEATRAAGLLGGLMFSGCGATEGPYGRWKDTHMPHSHEEGTEYFAEGSLLTAAEMQRCIVAAGGAGGLAYLGAKITAKNVADARDVAARVGLNRDILGLIAAAAVASAAAAPVKRDGAAAAQGEEPAEKRARL